MRALETWGDELHCPVKYVAKCLGYVRLEVEQTRKCMTVIPEGVVERVNVGTDDVKVNGDTGVDLCVRVSCESKDTGSGSSEVVFVF
jgi:hypothetical protein